MLVSDLETGSNSVSELVYNQASGNGQLSISNQFLIAFKNLFPQLDIENFDF